MLIPILGGIFSAVIVYLLRQNKRLKKENKTLYKLLEAKPKVILSYRNKVNIDSGSHPINEGKIIDSDDYTVK